MSVTSQKKVNFHFVTGNPQTDTEKRTVRTIVRSNASNRRWRLVRETAAKSKSDSPKSNDSSTSPESNSSSHGPSLSRSSTESDEEQKSLKKRRLATRAARRMSKNGSENDTVLLPTSPVKTVNVAQYYIGGMPMSEVSMKSIHQVLQGTAATYARLFPAGSNKLVSSVAKEWFQTCLRTRGILHTALFCQARRAQAMRPEIVTLSGNELMLCQTEAVHAINDKLLQESTATDDESLRIVVSLTWHGPVKQEPARRTPRQVPLADLQALQVFMGYIACDEVHARGLARMVTMRGGLDTVQMPGLALMVSYGDVINASSHLRRPFWKYSSYALDDPDAVAGDEWSWSTRRPDHPLATLGGGFSAIHLWTTYERASQLQLVLSGLADYTRASYDFVKLSPIEQNQSLMSDQRNMIQHSLLSLCVQPEDTFEGRDLFEVVWLAAVAYSLIAVFPLKPNAARFDRLAHLIRQKMSNPELAPYWSQAPDLVLWIVVVGALCAIGTADRAWYVHALRQERDRVGMLNWTNLKLRLMEFLWFPLVSDPDGLELWEEVQQSSYVMPWESISPNDEKPAFADFHVRSRSGSAVTQPISTN